MDCIKTFVSAFLLSLLALDASGQKPALELIFTGIDNTARVQLDSIRIMNRTRGCDTVLLWPDTTISIQYSGISETGNSDKPLRVFQNHPNPVTDETSISVYIPERDNACILITDLQGRTLLRNVRLLQEGIHTFRLTPGSGEFYFLSVEWQGLICSIRIVNRSAGTRSLSLEYIGRTSSPTGIKASTDLQEFIFTPGNELLCIGYSTGLESGIACTPMDSTTYTFQYATNIPCPGTPTVEFEGQVYNTIQIFSQCWFRENLNAGVMLGQATAQTDNGIIEKYCYFDRPDSCTKYGGMYNWREMMKYNTQQGTQGICPPGWHLPTDEDWMVLEGVADSQYGIGDPEWDRLSDYRGFDAAKNLKSTSDWDENGNGTDLYGFGGKPGGCRYSLGLYEFLGSGGYWWTSTQVDSERARSRLMTYNDPTSFLDLQFKEYNFSVRCLKD